MRSKLRKLVNNLPFINHAKRHHPVEYALINGTHQTDNRHPSILHFSLNKSATQYVKKLLKAATAEAGMTVAHLNGYAFHSDFPYLDFLTAEELTKYQHVFKPKGYLYSVFGGMIDGISNLEDYLIVLMIRDPRDIVVSSYYSTAYSHPLPSKRSDKSAAFFDKRQNAQQITIDEYALQEAEEVLAVYDRYIDLLLNRTSNLYVTKYEQMVQDHHQWMLDLFNYCQLEVSSTLLATLKAEHERLRPKKEDINSHNRKGKAGDYKEKLKSSTIAILNHKFAHVLKQFDY